MRPLRVCIDARRGGGLYGGTEQVVIGLATGLSKLADGNEEYLFLTTPGNDDWIRPYVKGPCRLIRVGEPPRWASLRRRARERLAGHLPLVRPFELPQPSNPDLMASEGTAEMFGADVVHFLNQMAFLTDVPSIYHPHDLQHLHLPEFFSGRDLELRDLWYRAFCEQAELVVMMTSWGRRDLIERLGVDAGKVAVVAGGSVIESYPTPSADDLDRVRNVLDLPEDFLLYPAQPWPHKNHQLLFEALALVREARGEAIPVVCPGHKNQFYPALEERLRELRLDDSVNFTGFVSPLELRCLYELARGLVYPSRFEGFGLPVCEAMAIGLPVASSNSTALSEVAGDAALLFDPDDVKAMADAIEKLWSDPDLCADLVAHGKERSALFDWDHSARVFRAHYRRIGGRPLTAEDRELL